MTCPCGTQIELEACCGRYIHGDAIPETAEALMRSRYTAYATNEPGYVLKTHDPDSDEPVDEDDVRSWAAQATWHGLRVLRTERGGPNENDGVVEFVASYIDGKGKGHEHHEVSTFRKHDGRWYFRDGELVTPAPYVRSGKKVGRNEPCSCGSGKKFKKCCAASARA